MPPFVGVRYMTRSGFWVDPFSFTQKDINPIDFLSALYQSRAFGHWGAYSIMQHQLHVGQHLLGNNQPPLIVLAGLTHDFGEVYTADLITHVRRNPMLLEYSAIIDRVQYDVNEWFGTRLSEVEYVAVKNADMSVLRTELEVLNPHWLPYAAKNPRDPEVRDINKYSASARPREIMSPQDVFRDYMDLYGEMWSRATAVDRAEVARARDILASRPPFEIPPAPPPIVQPFHQLVKFV
jgi:hypothetical protein